MMEEIKFLKELQAKLKHQSEHDYDSQASPRFWVVRDYKWEHVADDHGERTAIYLPDAHESYSMQEYKENLLEEDDREIFSVNQIRELEKAETDQDIVDWVEAYEQDEFTLFSEAEIAVNVSNTFFLTKEACKLHIDQNQHHYTKKAHTYAMTAWRSPEVAKVWDILENFDWDKVGGGDD